MRDPRRSTALNSATISVTGHTQTRTQRVIIISLFSAMHCNGPTVLLFIVVSPRLHEQCVIDSPACTDMCHCSGREWHIRDVSTGVRPVQTQRRRVCSALVLRADSSNDPGPGIRRGSATLLGSWLWRRRCQLHAGVYTNRGPTCTSPVRRSLLLFIYYASSAAHKKTHT